MDTDSDARTIKPGEPDHPAEQVKRAGREGSEIGSASYQARIVLRNGGSPLAAPTIDDIEGEIRKALEAAYPGVTVNVSAMRTDR